MTITDDERREVAAKMRGNADDMPFYGDLVADAAGADFVDDEACWKRLADLIEPAPTSSDRGPICDRDALLELADRVQLIHSDPSGMGREACDYYGIVGDLDCKDCEAYTSDSRCLELAIADVSRRIRAIANGLEGGSSAPLAGNNKQGGTDAIKAKCYLANETVTGMDEGRSTTHALLGSLAKRLMPEGMEWLVDAWPRFEDDSPVHFGDTAIIDGEADMVEAVQLWIHGKPVIYGDGGSQQLEKGERVRRPAPKVLAADGKPLREGETVYKVGGDGIEFTVIGLPRSGEYQAVKLRLDDGAVTGLYPYRLTHQRPVLGADGVPIETCQKMWRVRNGEEVRVSQIDRGEHPLITYIGEDGLTHEITPDGLTHTKPEPPDSAERIADEIDRLREEVALHLGDYLYDEDGNDSIQFSMELVAKRCRALAERERGE